MKRADMLAGAHEHGRVWDFLIIGGGATGLGMAVDAASRGHSVLLVERGDFACATSSRSTKLIHGGVRYLQQGNVALVIEALKERGRLRRNAPHIVHDLAFVVPSYAWWESPFYGVGLKLYDLLAGEYGFGASAHLDPDEVQAAIPNIETAELRGGTRYYDGQFDDARLALALAETAAAHGAVLLNYCPLIALRKTAGQVRGALVRDVLCGDEFEVRAHVVVNATGAYCDAIRQLDDPAARPLIAPSQGTHLVLPARFMSGNAAIMVPHTADGRLIFLIPWLQRVLIGTTDIALTTICDEPLPQAAEIDFLLDTANRYLAQDAYRADILSAFAGIRPLVSAEAGSTAALSREHSVLIDPQSGLMSVAGGKWTTYRRMAEDAVDIGQTLGGLVARPCRTVDLPITGGAEIAGHWLHPGLPLTDAKVIHACRHEMAQHVDDVLARRSRCLLLDAGAAVSIAPQVATLMAAELDWDAARIASEIKRFEQLAAGYRPPL